MNSIKLRNVRTFTGREGNGLYALVYVGGIKTAWFLDDANGMPPKYDVVDQKMFEKVNAWCDQQPSIPIVLEGKPVLDENENPMKMKITFEDLIDKVFNAMQIEKAHKIIKKKLVYCLIWGVPGSARYHEIKMNLFLSDIPTRNLQEIVDKVHLKPGERFFNDLAKLNIHITH